jgi:phage replication-related protein YjqB (UPF0714/DUF867 family)
VIVLAIHGGRIEKGTDQLAKAIAQDDHSYYIFNALIYEDSNNDGRNDLHLTSTHFDEPTALKMTTQKHKVVSIHGAAGDDPIVYMGGRNKDLMNNISRPVLRSNHLLPIWTGMTKIILPIREETWKALNWNSSKRLEVPDNVIL